MGIMEPEQSIEEKIAKLPELYHDLVTNMIDERGVFPHQLAAIGGDGGHVLAAVDLRDSEAACACALAMISKVSAQALMFGMDRYTKPGQGTTLSDAVVGFFWQAGVDGYRVFVIEYQHQPMIVKPICWENAFWNEAVQKELPAGILRWVFMHAGDLPGA